MYKAQIFTAIAVLVAGASLRPILSSSSQKTELSAQRRSQKLRDTKQPAAQPSIDDGPWKASCRYWQPGRLSPSAGANNAQPSDCGEDGWGISTPNDSGASPITAIIATVPDPIHSAFPLEFDRSIDVITQAASEYGFTGSYFWLPWRPPGVEAEKESSSALDEETQQNAKREKLPGLMIFKRSGAIPSDSKRSSSDENVSTGDVLYLFLVSQSPALGMNAAQLKNALAFEKYLSQQYGACLSFKVGSCRRDSAVVNPPPASTGHTIVKKSNSTSPPPQAQAKAIDSLDIIGPNNSGAAASLVAALNAAGIPKTSVTVAGITSTDAAATTLNQSGQKLPTIRYLSFGDDGSSEQDQISKRFQDKQKRTGHIAFLTESGTVYGQASIKHLSDKKTALANNEWPKQTYNPPTEFLIQFPRNISLLRNAQKESAKTPEGQAAASVSPYMHLSLKDSTSEDGVPSYIPTVTEFSQEAQWMSIAHELRQKHISVVAIAASNILDELFLINFLNRDVPDARVVVYSDADLLFTRIGDNAPYVGTVTFTAYPFTAASSSSFSMQLHSFSNAFSEAFFNAASYILWDGQPTHLRLANYEPDPEADAFLPPPLWATAVGRDGYYPLGILSQCASQNAAILPLIRGTGALERCSGSQSEDFIRRAINNGRAIFPSISWYIFCALITVICISHSVGLFVAKFWTSLTRDLAIRESDQPRRRAVYIHIAIAVLFSMSFIVAFPAFAASDLIQPKWYTTVAAAMTFVSGLVALIVTIYKTRGFLGKPCQRPAGTESACMQAIEHAGAIRLPTHGFYVLFNTIAFVTALIIPAIWVYLCTSHSFAENTAYVGLFFSYRCLYPASGVCPLLPVLLILMTWYIWAHLQTRRLRFSENNRPLMPLAMDFAHVPRLFVSDQDLSRCASAGDCCLYENMTCLLITRQIIQRFMSTRYLNLLLGVVYVALFCVFVVFFNIQGLDRFLHEPSWFPAPYELLVAALYYPLLLIALAGCVRMLVIWSSLNNGLLEPLERSPLRFAFSHLTNVAWTTMLRQSGFLEYRRDLARSSEAIRHLSHSIELHNAGGRSSSTAKIRNELESHIRGLYRLYGMGKESVTNDTQDDAKHVESRNFLLGCDLPGEQECRALNLMCAIECDYASYSKAILRDVLIPYWLHKQGTFVEAESPEKSSGNDEPLKAAPGKPEGPTRTDPIYIQLAEEFLAIRYLSLIRAVLINLRFLMSFVSTAFVLALLAWNSYPFQPRRWVDWTFTIMLFGIGAAVVWVFAQMHRNSILSRITGTKVNELGSAFFVRLVTYGTVPLLTWLASQFPVISNEIARLLQSGLAPVK